MNDSVSPNRSDDQSFGPDQSNLFDAYLSGELTGSQRRDFEASLSQPSVANELLRASDAWLAVAEASPQPLSTPTVNLSETQSPRVPRWVSIIACIAATLLLVVGVRHSMNDDKAGEELAIAQTWLTQQSSVSFGDKLPSVDIDAARLDFVENEAELADGNADDWLSNDVGSDDELGWMLAALQTESSDG